MTAVANPTVFPTVNDIAATEREGCTGTEAVLSGWLATTTLQNYVHNGLGYHVSSGLVVHMESGLAFIDGFRVNVPADTAITLTASVTNHIWLSLSLDGSGFVDGVDYTVNTTGVEPANAVKLFEIVTDGSSVTSDTDVRQFSQTYNDNRKNEPGTGVIFPTSFPVGWTAIVNTSIVVPARVMTYARPCIVTATLVLTDSDTAPTEWYHLAMVGRGTLAAGAARTVRCEYHSGDEVFRILMGAATSIKYPLPATPAGLAYTENSEVVIRVL